MFMKLLGGIIVICTSMMIGFSYTAKFKKRIEFLRCFNHDIILLKSRIIERETLSRAFMYVSKFSQFKDLWIYWADNTEVLGIRAAFEKSLFLYKDSLCLSKTDLKTISMLANGLGKTDINSQKEHIDYVSEMIKILCRSAESDYDKNCRLYRSASLLAGILTVILFF